LSAPGMKRRLFSVEKIFAQNGILPAHRIVERAGPGVAPMPVEPVLGERRTSAGQFEQLIGGRDRDLCRKDLGFGSDDLRFGEGIGTRVGDRPVDGIASFSRSACAACRRSARSPIAWIV